MQPASAHTNPEPGRTAQGELRCSRCGRGNVPDAKFCTGCGIDLAKAAEATAEALDAPLSAEVFKPLPQRDPQFAFRVAVVSGVLAVVLVGGGYYVYRNLFFPDFSPAYKQSVPAAEGGKRAAPSQPSTGAETAATGVIAPAPIPQGEAATIAPESAALARPDPPRSASPQAGPPQSTPMQSAPPEPRAPRRAAPARVAVKPAPIRAESCTEELSAVGLCSPAAPQAARAPADAASKPAAAPQPGTGSCEQGVSALGLCTPASNQ